MTDHHAMTHMRRFRHNARLASWRTLIAYLVLHPNGEESLSKFLSPDPDPDPDYLRIGPSHGHNTSSVKNSSQSEL